MARMAHKNSAVRTRSAWEPAGGGELGDLIRAHDWAATPLGPMETWPQSLRTAVDLVLGCDFPMVVLWGPDLVQIYNNGYRAIMANKHPAGLGQPTRECWREVWHINEPIYRRVLGGETLTFDDALYPINRHGYLEDARFTLCYSPLRNEGGDPAGVLVTVFETTQRHLDEEVLRASEENLRLVTNNLPAFIGYIDRDLRYVWVNDGFCAFLGAPEEEIIGSTVRERLGDRVFRRLQLAMEVALSGETATIEDMEPDKFGPGQHGWTEETYVPRLAPDGSVPGFWVLGLDITERKRVEAAMQVERARLQAMIDTIPIGFMFFDGDGTMILANEEAKRIWTGTASREGEGIDYRAFWPQTGKQLATDEWPAEQALLYGRTTPGVELEIERFDGTRATCLFSAAPIDVGGARIGAVVATQDITARKQVEAALQQSELRLRAFTDLVPDLLWSMSADGREVTLNRRWFEYTGQTEGSIENFGRLEAIHPDDRESTAAAVEAARATGTPMSLEHRVRRHDGVYRWFLVRHVPFRDESGTITQWFGAATDIHEDKAARDELEARVGRRTADLAAAVENVRRSEERLRLLLQQMPAMLWTTDVELRVMTVAGASVPAWPAVQGSVEGRDVADLFADADPNGAIEALHRRVLGGTASEFDFQVEGQTYAAHVEPLHDAEGKTIGTIGVAHDVTDRTLRKLQEDFIASVSHELQTPLTAIRAGLGLLETAVGETLGKAERELLSASRRNTERLRLQIDQLLAAHQLAVGDRSLQHSVIDLHELVGSVIDGIRPLLQEKRQHVDVDMPDPLEVEGDRRLLDRVLSNLLSNAHRHTPPETRIAVSGWFVGDDVRLAVHDTGQGVPADQLESIFHRFHRVPGSRREGIGLGLAIARDAVEAQGGHLWAESSPGHGTTFFVSLPRVEG